MVRRRSHGKLLSTPRVVFRRCVSASPRAAWQSATSHGLTMLAKLASYTLVGLDATPVEVEVDVPDFLDAQDGAGRPGRDGGEGEYAPRRASHRQLRLSPADRSHCDQPRTHTPRPRHVESLMKLPKLASWKLRSSALVSVGRLIACVAPASISCASGSPRPDCDRDGSRRSIVVALTPRSSCSAVDDWHWNVHFLEVCGLSDGAMFWKRRWWIAVIVLIVGLRRRQFFTFTKMR